jgi:NADH-quinone oxidoreductase subunit A
MPSDFLPILLLIAVSVILAALALGVPAILGPRRKNPVKLLPYESGKIPFQSPRERPFPVKHYLFAMMFAVVDMVVVFLYLWAAQVRELGWAGFLGILLFLLIAFVGYVYVWRKGALEWD